MDIDRVVVINDASRARGGATGLALLSVRLLRARGLPVTYICGDDGANDELAALGVTVVAAGSAGLLARGRAKAMARGIYNPATRDMLRRHIAAHDTPGTVYHVHGWAQILSPSIFHALGPVAARVVIHAHDMFLACPNGVYMDYPRNEVCRRRPLGLSCLATNCDKRSYAQKGWRVLRQGALRHTLDLSLPWAAILPIHPGMIPALTRAGLPERLLQVVRNPAEPFTDTRIEAEKNAGFVYVGRLERDKGPLELAAAARRCGVGLTLVGEGSLRPVFEADYPDITITGWADRAGIAAHASSARALVMPSHHPEPFALVIPEASRSGLPVIVAETALMAPEIVSAELGQAVNVFDPAAMDAALREMADLPPENVAQISHRAFDGAAELALSVEGWADALLAQYRRALAALSPAA